VEESTVRQRCGPADTKPGAPCFRILAVPNVAPARMCDFAQGEHLEMRPQVLRRLNFKLGNYGTTTPYTQLGPFGANTQTLFQVVGGEHVVIINKNENFAAALADPSRARHCQTKHFFPYHSSPGMPSEINSPVER